MIGLLLVVGSGRLARGLCKHESPLPRTQSQTPATCRVIRASTKQCYPKSVNLRAAITLLIEDRLEDRLSG